MQKLSARLASLISIFAALPLSPQTLLASEPTIVPITPYNLGTQNPTSFYDFVPQPIRLKISLSRRQVTVYEGTTPVKSYPIAVGRRGWETPIGEFRISQMFINPTWVHPFKDVVISGGSPENPLGRRWIGFWTDGKNSIGFHGTPNPESVGKAASHGCIRMYNKDVEELFQQVSIGTPVAVVR